MSQRDNNVTIKKFTMDYIEQVTFIHANVVDGWSENSLKADLENALSQSFVLVDEMDNVLAFCSFSICGEGELSFVCTHPEKRQRGYAYVLLKSVMDKVNAQSFTLEVRSQNKSAIKLYEKLDFRVLGTRKNMYESPRDDGIVMQKVNEKNNAAS